jgi:hypothetical protein
LQRLAIDELELAERSPKISQEFSAKTIELDPLVMAIARATAVDSSDSAIFADLYTAIKHVNERVAKDEAKQNSRIYTIASEWAQKRAHLSRAMRRLAQIWALS